MLKLPIMSYQKTVAKNIKKHCKLNKLSYSELARRAKLPLRTIQNILYASSRKEPRLSTIHAIAKAFKIKIDNLLK